MTNNTQHHIQVKHLSITITTSFGFNTTPKIQTTIPNQTDYHIHIESLNIVIIIKLWFSTTFYPTTTSSFLKSDGLICLAITTRLSPLFLKDLWVKMSMNRTQSTILATSRNKEKHLSSPYCFVQAREYNTHTNPLPLLHISEEDPFSLVHTGKRVITSSLGTKNLTQHLIPPRVFKQGKTLPTCTTWESQIANKIHTTTSYMGNKVPWKTYQLTKQYIQTINSTSVFQSKRSNKQLKSTIWIL